MDFQALILVNLTENDLQLDPKKEDQYYEANAKTPWLMANVSRAFVWAIKSLRSFYRTVWQSLDWHKWEGSIR